MYEYYCSLVGTQVVAEEGEMGTLNDGNNNKNNSNSIQHCCFGFDPAKHSIKPKASPSASLCSALLIVGTYLYPSSSQPSKQYARSPR